MKMKGLSKEKWFSYHWIFSHAFLRIKKCQSLTHLNTILQHCVLEEALISLLFWRKMHFATEHSKHGLGKRQMPSSIDRGPGLGCQRASQKGGRITPQPPSVECFPDSCNSWPSQVWTITRGAKEVHSCETRRKIPCLSVKQHCF